jgi:hypothetical protein
VPEIEHLVQHGVAKTFNLGHAVADFPDDADRLPGGRGFRAGDLLFDFLQEVSHVSLPFDEPTRDVRCSTVAAPCHSRDASAINLARMLPSYTSLPTLIRMPPMSAGFSPNDISSVSP